MPTNPDLRFQRRACCIVMEDVPSPDSKPTIEQISSIPLTRNTSHREREGR